MEELVHKLDSPIEEIQRRALESIHDKLRYKICNLNDLVTKTNICEILVKLLSDRTNTENLNCKSILPQETKILSLLKTIAEECHHGRQTLVNLNLDQVLEQWTDKYQSYHNQATVKLTEALRDIFSNLTAGNSNQSLLNSYGKVNDDDSSSIVGTTDFLNRRNFSLPPHLLQIHEDTPKRDYSPITRNYVKKVTFDSGHLDESGLEEESLPLPMASVFHWQCLSKQDRKLLDSLHSALTSFKAEVIRDACVEFQGETLTDFLPEIFLQRPDIIFALQDILLTNTNQALRALSAQALSELCTNLSQRWKFCKQVKSNRADSLLQLMSTTAEDNHDETIDDDSESFADPINTTQLKRRQLEPNEFALMILSNVGLALQDSSTTGRSANALYELFMANVNLLPLIYPYELHLYKDAEESIHEIESEFLKALILLQRGQEQTRAIFLLTLKAAITLAGKINNAASNLSAFIQSCALDSTLYLSHQHLHEQIASPSVFEEVQKALQSINVSIKIMLEQKVPKIKDLETALPALTFHENYRQWIPMILQVAQSVRDEGQANLASRLLLQLLDFPSPQIRSEAFFQLHDLVQGVLGVGQAIGQVSH